MLKILALSILLAACGDNLATSPDAGVLADSAIVPPGSVAAAELAIQASICRYQARCTGADPTACATSAAVIAAVGIYCNSHACAGAYADWARLDACIAAYDAIGCTSPAPIACPL